MKTFKLSGLLALLLLLTAVSCTTSRTLGYLLDMEYNKDYPATPAPELKMQKEDRLSIQVLSENAELSAPFNTLLTITDLANNTVHEPKLTYVVDKEGNIDFPVLGKLHIEGMTLKEIAAACSVTPDSAKTMICAARKQLMQTLNMRRKKK